MESSVEKKQTMYEEILDTDLGLFVGKNSDMYLEKWKNGCDNKKWGINWAALFLGFMWLGYRKMYKYIAYIFGFLLVADIFQYIFDIDMRSSIGLGLTVAFGAIGNKLYYDHSIMKIRKIYKTNESPENISIQIEKEGGTSIVGIFISVGMLLVYVALSVFLDTVINGV